ncbi:hypothetical protein [Propylenella binzhouense]|uniref:Uncharacterized protein n=1 Tax=Propylenella binzhouense TaxID=2555902 RepID=A0A964WT07_9HYPH|nr:hypothetical protein [Propylenella binzhouense]MYZ47527.1 hypothetical protein [Propylenella binzhouense]
MPSTQRYRVVFFKTVGNGYGRDLEICQRAVDVAADSEGSAVAKAIACFCRAEKVRAWTDHADRYAVREAPRRATADDGRPAAEA